MPISISSSGNVRHGYRPKETPGTIFLGDACVYAKLQFISTRAQGPLNTLIFPRSSNSFAEQVRLEGSTGDAQVPPQAGPHKKGRFFLQVTRTKPCTRHKSSSPNQDTGTQAADVIESENWAPSHSKFPRAARRRLAWWSPVSFWHLNILIKEYFPKPYASWITPY